MSPLLATATATDPGHAPGWAILTIAALAWIGWYPLACWIWPFRACPRCGGTGKRHSPSGKAFRLCRRCKGTGRRLRAGRRVYNYARQIHADATP